MSRYFSDKYSSLVPYVPGEQPKDQQYIKLNTNENPFPPHKSVFEAVRNEALTLHLYSDPDCIDLINAFCKVYDVSHDEVVFTNGSDDILNFAFMAFCDENHPAAFADITYGFYPVFAETNHLPYSIIPLKDDFSIDINDYIGINKTIFIANPNAPTGIAISVRDIERIVSSNPNNVVIIDEAYVDFGAESCIPLIHKYKNLLVIQTFSKSRSMAGARLGFAVGCSDLINDLNTLRFSTNPYNINRLTSVAGVACLNNDEYNKSNCKTVIENREYLSRELKLLGFELTDSKANFLFVKSDRIDGEDLYIKLKEKGVLIRHFSKDKIKQYNRITVGTKEQCDILINKIKEIIL